MDAVEVNCSVDVAPAATAVPELYGGGGRDRVMVVEMAVELRNSLLSEKDVAASSLNALEPMQLDKVPAPELYQHTSHQPSFPSEDVSKQFHFGSAKVPSWIPRHEEVQVQRKLGQVSRSGSGCSKRPRIILLDDTAGLAVIDDTKETSNKLGSHPTKCNSNGKTPSTKQRNNVSIKRGDRKNGKVSMKAKHDSFSLKASLASFSSAAAGNNFFGLYGLKTDVNDITKLVDDLSLDDLLLGAYDCPKISKDKDNNSTDTSENILQSVRKACSILQPPKSNQSQNAAEMDSCSNEKMPTCQSSCTSVAGNGDCGDSSMADLSSSHTDSCSKPEASANFLSFSFEQPKDTLERLALPPPKDLETLLLDAVKPAVPSRNGPDARHSKQATRKHSLPPFFWSHSFNSNCKTNSDAVKLLTSRSTGTCQGRWVKVENTFNSQRSASKCFTDLESLAYDDTLVPSSGPKLAVLRNGFAPSTLAPQCDRDSSVPATSLMPVEQCPRILEAAQTLCDFVRLNQEGMIKWPKKPSQKGMKARKSKSIEKPEDKFAPSTSGMGSEQAAKSRVDHILTSKKLKLSTIENKKDHLDINGSRKGPINWSTPKSSRSSPNKSVRDPTAYIVKQSCRMSPPAKVVNRNCNGQQKFRKLMRMDWSRERDRQD
ncbi:uncharacterized protein LOC126678011 isoform X2 [Mercurialis annua]|uniref:uncharacterized protein LOC126678011 isoform X2 n=1 Tax=Mercurialis annua TaxID=3986 RepID=UPI002160C9D6|nr:uncharacterized protein LOC126678011 isoform X2 [Mercurialis annua]